MVAPRARARPALVARALDAARRARAAPVGARRAARRARGAQRLALLPGRRRRPSSTRAPSSSATVTFPRRRSATSGPSSWRRSPGSPGRTSSPRCRGWCSSRSSCCSRSGCSRSTAAGRASGGVSSATSPPLVWVLAPQLTTHLFVVELPREVVRPDAPAGARPDGDGRLPVDDRAGRRRVLRAAAARRGARSRRRIAAVIIGRRDRAQAVERDLPRRRRARALVARRWRGSLVFAACLAPALLTLALWKYRGLGHLPLFASAPVVREAAGGPGAPLASAGDVRPSRLAPLLADDRRPA